MGYTQEEFAEKCGIGLASLKKYIKGQNVYNYELMEIFAKNLECSYDYLMGKSASPKRKYQDISNVTRLSDEAIEILMKYAKLYDKSLIGKTFIETVNVFLRSEGLVNCLGIYLSANNQVRNAMNPACEILQNMYEQAIKQNKQIADLYEKNDTKGLDDLYLILLVSELKDARRLVDKEVTEQNIKNTKSVEKWLREISRQDE